MMQNHSLAKAIGDVGWNGLISKIKYKADWTGKEVVVIDRFYPSSKTCSCCGNINHNLTLNQREWTCVECSTKHDRDINASKNILTKQLHQ